MLIKKRKKVSAKRKIPKTVQHSIPIDVVYRDGIIQCGHIYSKTWRFSDINYEVASNADQEEMFLAHGAILNGLPTDATAKISIYNRQLQHNIFKQMAAPAHNTKYGRYTKELEELLSDKMAESNNIVHEKYMTVASEKRNIQEDGLNTVMPYGLMNIYATRTLTTESTAVLIPYKTQEIIDDGGLYYGINSISHNLLMCNNAWM